MTDHSPFADLDPTTLADVLGREQVMDLGIRPVWAGVPRVAGPAFPVVCAPGDMLMLHAAIYRAPVGSVLVVRAGDHDFAVAGGNVCAIAQRHGIAGLVVDGVIRDLREVRELRFPVFARGIVPKPGTRAVATAAGVPAQCGGVTVRAGDIVVADEEGIVVTPADRVEEVLAAARARAAADAAQTLDQWETAHRAGVAATLGATGFTL
jgi:4-hydroxy-4-methyl-2-oxoglutarate aldolase